MSGLIVLVKYLIRGIVSCLRPKPIDDNPLIPEDDDKSYENENVWIINGKCYNLQPFLKLHPGGRYILLINRGRDCTELFYSYHLSTRKNIKFMELMLKKYYICDARKDQILSPFNWNDANKEMYLDFQSRIEAYFNENPHLFNRDKATKTRLFYYILLFISLIITYYYWLQAYWCTIPLLSLIHFLLSTELLHNGTHYQIVRNPNLNIMFGLIGGFYHAPNIQWEMQHVISHHSYTNIDTLDVDLNHFLDNFRTSKKQEYRPIYAKWRWFIAIYVCFASLGQIDSWGAQKHRNIHRLMVPYWIKNKKWTFVYIIYMIQVAWIFAALPLAILLRFGWNQFLKAFLFVFLIRIGHGILFYIFSQVSHIQSDAFYDDDSLQTDNWVIHQIQSSVDYSINSTFWNFMSLGLNNQAIHHLCPGVHTCHFMRLQPVLNEFCKDYNIKRRVFPNLYDILCAHFKHLAAVNDSARNEISANI